MSRLARELESLALVARAAPVDALVRRIIDSGGYRRELAASPLADDAEALRNFDRLERLAAGIPADGLVGLRAFVTYLDRAEEAEDFDLGGTERPAPDPTAVTVTTVHRAKGLEWPVVFIPGLVEGKFPLKPHADRDRPDRVPYPLRAREAGLPPFPQTAFASDADLEAARNERDETSPPSIWLTSGDFYMSPLPAPAMISTSRGLTGTTTARPPPIPRLSGTRSSRTRPSRISARRIRRRPTPAGAEGSIKRRAPSKRQACAPRSTWSAASPAVRPIRWCGSFSPMSTIRNGRRPAPRPTI